MSDNGARISRRVLLASGALAALPTLAADDRALTVAAYPLVDEIVGRALPQWQKLHPDVPVQVIRRQYGDHHIAMTTALSTSSLLPDVMVLASGYVGRFARGRGLQDLAAEPYRIDRFRPKLVPFAYDQALAPEGGVVAMPTDIGPGTMLYREDVLQRSGLQPEALTESWEQYVAAGLQIRARTGAYLISHAQTVKDILIRTGLAPGEGIYFDKQSRVLVESPRFERAFKVAREIRRNKLDARVPSWSNQWSEGLRRGTLVTELSGAWLVGQLSSWVAPRTAGLWRAAALPGGAQVSYGGSFFAIPRLAAEHRKAAAWQFIQLMTLDPERQLTAFKDYDAFPALLETHDDPFFEQPVQFLGGQPARRLWRDAARRIAASAVHKQDGFADEVVGSELDKVLERDKPIAKALADAQRLLARRALR